MFLLLRKRTEERLFCFFVFSECQTQRRWATWWAVSHPNVLLEGRPKWPAELRSDCTDASSVPLDFVCPRGLSSPSPLVFLWKCNSSSRVSWHELSDGCPGWPWRHAEVEIWWWIERLFLLFQPVLLNRRECCISMCTVLRGIVVYHVPYWMRNTMRCRGKSSCRRQICLYQNRTMYSVN